VSKYLLDTHAIIWYLDDSAKLSAASRGIIDNPENSIFICSVSLWEIAIKVSLHKLELGMTLEQLLSSIASTDFTVLQIEDAYIKSLLELPLIHKDPFDRLIIATALYEHMTIVSVDENIHQYDITCIW